MKSQIEIEKEYEFLKERFEILKKRLNKGDDIGEAFLMLKMRLHAIEWVLDKPERTN